MKINERLLRRFIQSTLTESKDERFDKYRSGKYKNPRLAWGREAPPMPSVSAGYTEETYRLKPLDGLEARISMLKKVWDVDASMDELRRLPINNEKEILEYIYSPEGAECLAANYPPHVEAHHGPLRKATLDSLKNARKNLPITLEDKFARDNAFLGVAECIVKYYFKLKYNIKLNARNETIIEY
jgi:hypothetical protein